MEKNKSAARRLIFLGALSYFGSYLTRVNLSAVIEELSTANVLSKEILALAVTFNVISYGIGLTLSGFLSNKFQPKYLMFMNFIPAALVNLVIPLNGFLGGGIAVVIAWIINGFAQALMWPALIKTFLYYLNSKEYDTGVFATAVGSGLASVLTYLMVPVFSACFGKNGWMFMFIIPAAFAFVLGFIWIFSDYKVVSSAEAPKQEVQSKEKIFIPIIAVAAFAIVLHGILRDGITTWMPTYINETFHLGAGISILSGVALPLFGIVTSWVSVLIIRKLRNPIFSASLIYAVAAVFCITLRVFNQNFIVAVLSMATVVGCMNGINLMLVSMVPKAYASTGKGALLSGVLNSFTYVGSAVSVYGIVLFSNAFGWLPTVSLWAGIAVLGTLVCALTLPVWNRKVGKKNGN